MKINRIRFQGFGQYLNREFQFSQGINLIEAPNEAGKSTLIKGIFALLYGRNREGYRKKTKAEWFEKYQPWSDKSIYGGEIEYQIENQAFQLYRALIDDDQQLIKMDTGEEISKQFPFDKKKERCYLDEQIGLSGELLKRISFINSLSFAYRNTTSRAQDRDQELMHRFTLLMRQGDEIDIDPVIDDLKREMEAIGTQPQAQSTPFGQVCRRIKQLKLEIRELEDTHQNIENEEKQWKEFEEQTTVLAEELEQLKQQIQYQEQEKQKENKQLETCHQLEKLQIKMDHIKQKEQERTHLKQRKTQLEKHVHDSPFALIDIRDVERFLQLCQEIESMNKQKKKLEEDQQQLEKVMSQEVAPGQGIQQEIEESQEMLNLLDQYEHLEELYRSQTQIEESEKAQEENWQKDVGTLQNKGNTHLLRHQSDYWLAAAILFILSSVAFGQMNFYLGLSAAGFALISLVKWSWIFYQRLETKRFILQKWQVTTLDELLKIKKKWDSERSIEGSPISEWEDQMEGIRQKVREWLTSFRKGLSPFDPKGWKKEILFLQRQFQFRLGQEQRRDVQISFLKIQLDRLGSDLRTMEQENLRLRQLLGINEEMDWRDWKNEWQKEQTIFLRLQELEQEMDTVEETKILEKWDEQKQKVGQEIELTLYFFQGACCKLPYEDKNESLQKLQKKYQEKNQQSQEMKQRLAELKGSLDVRHKQLKNLSELEGELRSCKEQKMELEQRRSSCQLAIEMFRKARKQVHEDVTPRIAPHASKWVSMITKEKYQRCHISPENGFTLRFQEHNSGKLYPVERLSRGTVDQIYFALRLAFIQFFSQKTQPALHLPLFLDDSFVHFDRSRLRKTLNILHQFSQKHQIFMCTCHHREKELLEKENIPFQLLSL